MSPPFLTKPASHRVRRRIGAYAAAAVAEEDAERREDGGEDDLEAGRAAAGAHRAAAGMSPARRPRRSEGPEVGFAKLVRGVGDWLPGWCLLCTRGRQGNDAGSDDGCQEKMPMLAWYTSPALPSRGPTETAARVVSVPPHMRPGQHG